MEFARLLPTLVKNWLNEFAIDDRVAIKLPKLTLKPFSGDLLDWLTFWDGLASAIDHNTDLSNVDKMNYLTGLLKGEAARTIPGLLLSNGNYTRAVQILQQRYGQKQTLINHYLNALSKIPPTTMVMNM